MTRRVSFAVVAATLGLLMFAASAPSRLYVVYQAQCGFSAITLTNVYALGLVGVLIVAGVVSAARIDLQPPARAGLAALVNSVAPALGLAAGALGVGALVQYATVPTWLVSLLLLGAVVAALAATVAMPESAPGRGGAGVTLGPRVSVAADVRGSFGAVAPCLIAVWALGGLYLSLGPRLAAGLLHSASHLVGGLVVATLIVAGAAGSIALRAWPAQRATAAGCFGLVVGMAVTLGAIDASSTPLFFVGTAVAGVGVGGSFLGALRWLAGLARPDDRAALIAANYVVSYLAFSLPTIAAGSALEHVGRRTTTYIYGAFDAVLASAATTAMAIRPAAASMPSRPRTRLAPRPSPAYGTGR